MAEVGRSGAATGPRGHSGSDAKRDGGHGELARVERERVAEEQEEKVLKWRAPASA